METALYLDTARMGALSPAAKRACQDFLALAAAEGCSPAFEAFLRAGIDTWTPALRDDYPGLADWHGLAVFKERLLTFAGLPGTCPVLLANRTSHLMRLAARLLFLRCRRVLVTDLEWPPYLTILDQERRRTGRELFRVPLGTVLLEDRCSVEEAVHIITTCYETRGCDGLFLSSVTYQGLRLPVRELVQTLSAGFRPPFVVVDGAQALGHVPTEFALDYCDFYIAGAHKWLETTCPMGLEFCARRGSQEIIKAVCVEMIEAGELDDPLLRFAERWGVGPPEPFGETVSLGSPFPCAAAVNHILADGGVQGRFERLVSRARELEKVSAETAWKPVVPNHGFRSGILLLRSDRPGVRAASVEQVRRCFQEQGVALTAYGDGLVRLSAPPRPLGSQDIDRLRSALSHCG